MERVVEHLTLPSTLTEPQKENLREMFTELSIASSALWSPEDRRRRMADAQRLLAQEAERLFEIIEKSELAGMMEAFSRYRSCRISLVREVLYGTWLCDNFEPGLELIAEIEAIGDKAERRMTAKVDRIMKRSFA